MASALLKELEYKVENLKYKTVGGFLGDPGADSGDEGKPKRAEKYDTKKSKERRSLLFFVPYFFARLDFPSPPLSSPGSPRMGWRPRS